jgi:hypothetical protein
VTDTSACRIDVLAEAVSISPVYANLERDVAASSGEVAISISDAEVAWAAAESPLAARFELRLTAEASAAKAATLASLTERPFRVSCNDQTLFVGYVYQLHGAAVLRTPVLHIEESAGVVVLRLGAWQGAWSVFQLADAEVERARIDRPELRAALCARGVLEELDTP